MKSKYFSFCPKCRQRIRIGDEILKENGVWVHETCPNTKNILRHAIELVEKPKAKSLAKPPSAFVPSNYQRAIFEFVENGKGHAVVEATAGSGKTTTIVKALEIVPQEKKTVFLAFNRHIVAELKSRISSPNVTVATIHSLGLSIIRKANPRAQIDEEKTYAILDEFWPVGKEIESHIRLRHKFLRSQMAKVVSLAKSTLVDVNNRSAVEQMLERYDFDMNGEQTEIIKRLPEVIEKCRNLETIDFDDMPWLPVVENMNCEQFDFVFVDEAQDLNACNTEFLLRIVSPTGRIIAVGDRRQSLYAFRGANPDAIPNLIARLNATVLPLSITYRCPKSHVREIKRLAPEIESAETAQEGLIAEIKYSEFLEMLRPGDMVLCRINASLVNPAFECIRRGKKASIKGKDIGKSLIEFVERFNANNNLYLLLSLMEEFVDREYKRLTEKGKDLQAANVIEKFQTIQAVARQSKSVDDLTEKLLVLFSDNNVGITFSSIHRAKGLEAERVFVLRRDLMPHPKAKQEWELVQESNIMFVAGTRSRNELYYVGGEDNG